MKKDITIQSWENKFNRLTPSGQTLVIASMCKIPVGASIYEEAIEENPWYFVEETEYRRKWNLVPQEVKDTHSAEFLEFIKEKDPNQPYINGITGTTEEQWKAYFKYLDSTERKSWQEARDKKETKIWNKYFKEYRLEK